MPEQIECENMVVSVRTEQGRRCVYLGNEEVSERMCVGGRVLGTKEALERLLAGTGCVIKTVEQTLLTAGWCSLKAYRGMEKRVRELEMSLDTRIFTSR